MVLFCLFVCWGLFGFFFLVTGDSSTLKSDPGQDLFQHGMSSNAVVIHNSNTVIRGEIEFNTFLWKKD